MTPLNGGYFDTIMVKFDWLAPPLEREKVKRIYRGKKKIRFLTHLKNFGDNPLLKGYGVPERPFSSSISSRRMQVWERMKSQADGLPYSPLAYCDVNCHANKLINDTKISTFRIAVALQEVLTLVSGAGKVEPFSFLLHVLSTHSSSGGGAGKSNFNIMISKKIPNWRVHNFLKGATATSFHQACRGGNFHL